MTTEPTVSAEAPISFDSIKELMDGFDPASLLPELENVFSLVTQVCRWIVLIGPALLLILGLVYLFLAPKEANHYVGYRCYFGMGSIQAWRFTQRLAGVAFAALGLGLGIVMYLSGAGFAAMEVEALVWKAAKLLLWQAGLALAVNVAIQVTAAVVFNHKGEYRRKKKNP